jgi:Chromo shadow domain
MDIVLVSNIICRGASEVLQSYFQNLGGRPQPPSKLGKRKSTSQLKTASEPSAPKRSKRSNGNDNESMDDLPQKTGSWMPKQHNWESEIASIDTVERDRETGKLWAFIYFTNSKRSKVGMEMVYKHCPIPMLKFYERHLSVFPTPQRSLAICLGPSTWFSCRRDLRRPLCIETDQASRKIGNFMPEDDMPTEY